MTTVIDIGCARYGGDRSIEHLLEAFHPDVVWGFDPNPAVPETFDGEAEDATTVHLRREAAWIYDGEIGYLADGLNSKVSNDHDHWQKVPCFDLAKFIHGLEDTDIVLKIDAEGAEYDLLDHLIKQGADKRLRLAWVEWHPNLVEHGARRRATIEKYIACEMEEWRW